MKKMILTVAAAAVVAVGAQAQTFATIGEILPLSNSVEASGSNVTYEWYYISAGNGVAAIISGCSGTTNVDCVVPSNVTSGFTDGQVVRFYRRAIAQDCAVGNSKNTTPITVTFTNVAVDGVRWAATNVAMNASSQPVFAADHTFANHHFFQFNRNQAWLSTGATPVSYPAAGVTWPAANPTEGNWDETANPVCPNGWRLPTQAECAMLNDNSNPIGGRWATATTSGFNVAGRFLGPKAGTCTSSNMAGCIFMPASRWRQADGAIATQDYAHTWTSTQVNANGAYALNLDATRAWPWSNVDAKLLGFPVRCVQ